MNLTQDRFKQLLVSDFIGRPGDECHIDIGPVTKTAIDIRTIMSLTKAK